jgi:Flp pilus assembly protein TadB
MAEYMVKKEQLVQDAKEKERLVAFIVGVTVVSTLVSFYMNHPVKWMSLGVVLVTAFCLAKCRQFRRKREELRDDQIYTIEF